MNAISSSALLPDRTQNQGNNFAKWFVLSAGGILLLDGSVKVLGVFASVPMPYLHEPIFGLPIRYLVLLVGMAELIVAYLLLFTKNRSLNLGCLASLAINLTVYRICLWTMGWPHPYALLSGVINGLNVSPHVADFIIGATLAYLLIGGIAVYGLECQPMCSHDPPVEIIKMTCVLCKGHIAFSSNNLGQKISCPHCKTAITLMRPKMSSGSQNQPGMGR